MVAGGLPERFAGHATEICLMAVDLLNAVTHLQLPNSSTSTVDPPDHTLQLKIGIHTGQLGIFTHTLPIMLEHHHKFYRDSHDVSDLSFCFFSVFFLSFSAYRCPRSVVTFCPVLSSLTFSLFLCFFCL